VDGDVFGRKVDSAWQLAGKCLEEGAPWPELVAEVRRGTHDWVNGAIRPYMPLIHDWSADIIRSRESPEAKRSTRNRLLEMVRHPVFPHAILAEGALAVLEKGPQHLFPSKAHVAEAIVKETAVRAFRGRFLDPALMGAVERGDMQPKECRRVSTGLTNSVLEYVETLHVRPSGSLVTGRVPGMGQSHQGDTRDMLRKPLIQIAPLPRRGPE